MGERIWSARGDTPFIRWAAVSRPMRGETVSGDRVTVQVTGIRTVLAVIDGLGHGPKAALAAKRARDVFDHHPAEPLEALLLLAHRDLAESRGVAATVAVIDGDRGTMQWLGVGNVDGVLVRADVSARPRSHGVFLVGGVLGHHLGRLHLPNPLSLEDGDLIVLATDGVRADLAEVVRSDQPVERLADMIITKHGRSDDDALVLVARYQGLQTLPDGDRLGDTAIADEQPRYGPLNRRTGPDQQADPSPYRPLGPSSTP